MKDQLLEIILSQDFLMIAAPAHILPMIAEVNLPLTTARQEIISQDQQDAISLIENQVDLAKKENQERILTQPLIAAVPNQDLVIIKAVVLVLKIEMKKEASQEVRAELVVFFLKIAIAILAKNLVIAKVVNLAVKSLIIKTAMVAAKSQPNPITDSHWAFLLELQNSNKN